MKNLKILIVALLVSCFSCQENESNFDTTKANEQ